MNQNDAIVKCPTCGVKNRLHADRIGRSPKCGRCGAFLPNKTQSESEHIKNQNDSVSDENNEFQNTEPSPATIWEQDAAKRALDELFKYTYHYKSTKGFKQLAKFVARFRFYSPFNAMLIHTQMPGARYVASPHRWFRDYKRWIKPGARPIVILQPRGPVMFVFDVTDTEPKEDAPPLPKEVEAPFEITGRKIGKELSRLTDNAKRDGVRKIKSKQGSQSAGSICPVTDAYKASQKFQARLDANRNPVFIDIPVKYILEVNENLSPEAQYATIVHELAHLYCGHLGTPNKKWWPDRRGLKHKIQEFEAESVTYLVCTRFGIDNPSDQYLSGYVENNEQIPPISLECVMKVAGLIEDMSRKRMKPR